MKIECWFVGKTTESYLTEGMEIYAQRIRRYSPFSVKIISPSKETDSRRAIEEEARQTLRLLKPGDFLVVLDEHGKQFTSVALSKELEKWMQGRSKTIVLLVGGAFGIGDEIRNRADLILSASKFTFTHQMIRLILLEQLYRAFSIINGEKYHHA